MDRTTRIEVDFVRRVLLVLFEGTVQKFHQDGDLLKDDGMRHVYEFLRPFTHSGQLEAALPSEGRLQGKLRDFGLLFLAFVEKGRALPVLDMSWNFSTQAERPEIRFRFFLLQSEVGASHPHAIGFRFEPPEGSATSDKSGSHDYWHAQMIAGFEKDDELLKKIVGRPDVWVPTKQPAFPLPAKSWGDLLAVLLLSIYGTKQLAKLLDDAVIRAELAKRLEGAGVRISSTSGQRSA